MQNEKTYLGITHARGQLKPGTTTNQFHPDQRYDLRMLQQQDIRLGTVCVRLAA